MSGDLANQFQLFVKGLNGKSHVLFIDKVSVKMYLLFYRVVEGLTSARHHHDHSKRASDDDDYTVHAVMTVEVKQRKRRAVKAKTFGDCVTVSSNIIEKQEVNNIRPFQIQHPSTVQQ